MAVTDGACIHYLDVQDKVHRGTVETYEPIQLNGLIFTSIFTFNCKLQ